MLVCPTEVVIAKDCKAMLTMQKIYFSPSPPHRPSPTPTQQLPLISPSTTHLISIIMPPIATWVAIGIQGHGRKGSWHLHHCPKTTHESLQLSVVSLNYVAINSNDFLTSRLIKYGQYLGLAQGRFKR